MPPKNKLSHNHKLQIIDLYSKGWRVFAIRNVLKRENICVTWAAIKNVIRQHEIGNFRAIQSVEESVSVFKGLSNKELGIIKELFDKDHTKSAREVQKVLEQNGYKASISTIKKAIDAAGFCASKPRYCQMIRDTNKQKRVDFCATLIQEDDTFDDAIFSDECSIQLHDNKTVAYRKKDACAPPQCRPKHPLKIHLWGAISKKGPSTLLAFDGIMDGTFYTDVILRDTLLPYIKAAFPGGHRFIQDNDPKHRSKKAKEFMETNGINWLSTWPSGIFSVILLFCT